MTTYTVHDSIEGQKDVQYRSVKGLRNNLKAFAERRAECGDGLRLTIRYDWEQDTYHIWAVSWGNDTRGYQSARNSIERHIDGSVEIQTTLFRTLPTGDQQIVSICRAPTVGDRIYTPRFCTVTISEVFPTMRAAERAGFNHSTHAKGIVGKQMDELHMRFAYVTEAD